MYFSVDARLADHIAIGQDLVAGLFLEVGNLLEDKARLQAVLDLQITRVLQTQFAPAPAQVNKFLAQLMVAIFEIQIVNLTLPACRLRQTGIQ